jgi:methylase of polypeptide subunit release factors
MKIASTLPSSLALSKLKESRNWEKPSKTEARMHKIHAYPAKFPAFLIPKAIEYVEQKGVRVNRIADIFCGCGTTAFEALRVGVDFWGCDINPVATLIAKVKSQRYLEQKLKNYKEQIVASYKPVRSFPGKIALNERIRYWFDDDRIRHLKALLDAIERNVPKGKYRDFFLCSFSNILKPTSRWLTKSIKPQIDPDKAPKDVLPAFEDQVDLMIRANAQAALNQSELGEAEIVNENFLDLEVKSSFAELLITSPPYVTSYEYADLHQLSSLWLGYADDYRKLRNGTIGSLYGHQEDMQEEVGKLNEVGKTIIEKMEKVERSKAKAVARYFIDLREAVKNSFRIVKKSGYAFFVIGNTKYKSVEVDNARYLIACMMDAGYEEIKVYKRKISTKILTPYRNKQGKFSKNSRHRQVYSHEFIVIGRKKG